MEIKIIQNKLKFLLFITIFTSIYCTYIPKRNLHILSTNSIDYTNYIRVKYKIEEISDSPILLFNSLYLSYISSMTLDGENLNVNNTYTFAKTGTYEIKIYLLKYLNNLEDLFRECIFLLEVDFGETIFSNVRSLKGLFRNCKNLKKINFGSLDTSNVVDMNGVFSSCSSLIAVDLSKFNTEKVYDMNYMFNSCIQLTSLDIINFNTKSVLSTKFMFSNCKSLTSLDLSNFDTSSVTNMNNMFDGCQMLLSLDLSKFNTKNVISLVYFLHNCFSLKSIDLSNFDTSHFEDISGMFLNCESLTSIDLTNFQTSNVVSMSQLFEGCSSLNILDVSKFITNKVQDMEYLFSRCKSLNYIDVSNFVTDNVEDMNHMFNGCEGLTSLDLTNFKTSKVFNMMGMFSGCRQLEYVDVRFFITTNLMYVSSIFSGCAKLRSLNLKNFDISGVNSVSSMFNGCKSLKYLNIENFNTKQVTQMDNMFKDCALLENLDLKYFDTSKVTTMENMFNGCLSLTSLDLNSFVTKKVINMNMLFANCKSLSYIDISNFNMINVKSYDLMFYSLPNIGYIFYNDDNVCVTCTKSYAASVKNFGRSHWCTASDQFGEYDGFEMFKNYTRDGILVQFYCKQDEDHSFQVQYVQMGRKIVPGAICDWEDDTMDVESVEKMLAAYNVSYKNIMKTVRANFKRLRAETLELRKDEEIYWSRKRDERVKNILKGIKKATSSNECIEFAKRVFKAKKYMRSADGVYGGSVMNDSDAVKTPLTYVYVFYEGKNQAEKDFLRWYFEDEGYEDAYYDVLNTAVFVFDKAGNIVNKYDGCAPIFMGTLMYITTMEDEGLYEGRTLYIVNIKTGKPIFSNPYGALGADDSQNYLEDIEDEMIEKVGRRCNIEDWFVVSPENGKAVAINYKNAKMVEITFESYMF